MEILNEKEKKKLSDFRILMLGFGAQGGAEARNLRKSKVTFQLALRKGPSFEKASEEGFEVIPLEEGIGNYDLILMNTPDQVQAELYQKWIENKAEPQYLVFAHGFNTFFKQIPFKKQGPKHILIAPKGAASGLEEFYSSSNALPAVLAYESAESTPPTDEERFWIEALAKAMGAHPKALTWAEFKDETVCDLFSEQVLLCGGVSSLLRRTYEVLTEAGYNKETAYFETLFELKLIVDLIWKSGITGMRSRISPTARYGDVTRGDRVIDDQVKSKMKEILKEIESGKFAKEFLGQIESKDFLDLQKQQAEHPIEKIGKRLRKKLAGA